jgi:putative spermidine/putrescine transport system ATP-binding protein
MGMRGNTGAAALQAKGADVLFDRICRRFGKVAAVDGVSLTIRSGEFFTLLGPSGSGKTTLLHLLAGFQEPDSGEIRLDGRRISGEPPFKRDIGMVFQSYALFPNMTVFENVAFPLRVRGVARAEVDHRVQEALGLVQLAGFEGRKTHQLSGGQQQRVALARAFVFAPRLLLMDEPLSALDAKLRRSMRLEIKELQRRLGITVVYVTHDQDEALALSDRIAVMNRGSIEQVDAPDELYERPASRFVADFLGEANLIEATVGVRNGNTVEVATDRHRFHVLASEHLLPGTRVSVAVRPERIVLDPEMAAANTVRGTVESMLYGGDHAIIRVDIGDSVLSLKRPVEAGPAPAAGAVVTIGWDIERGVPLSR